MRYSSSGSDMKVTIVGGWADDSVDPVWGTGVHPADRDTFMRACGELGARLATRGHTIVVGSAGRHTADFHLVQGFLSVARAQNSSGPRIEVIDGLEGGNGAPYAEERRALATYALFNRHGEQLGSGAPRAAEKLVATSAADALIAIGGRTDTYIAGIGALMANKVVIPIATFGGAAHDLHRAAQMPWKRRVTRAFTSQPDFERLADSIWNPAVIDAAMRFGGLDRPRVFLASSGQSLAIASEINDYLTTLGCDVILWSERFRSGEVILDEIRAASFACKYAVVLLTPDDQLAGEPPRWLPRGNVIFELGHFLNALGKQRTFVVAQDGVQVPADYSGHIYVRFSNPTDLTDVRTKLREALSQDLPGTPTVK